MKSLNIKEDTWREFSKLRIDKIHKSADDTLKYLLGVDKKYGGKRK